jgi:hypothetical protein
VAETGGVRHAGDPGGLVSGYEELREAVLCRQSCGWRLGHGLFAGRGMAAWMAACATVAPAPEPGTSAPDPSTPSTPTPSIHRSTAALSSLPGADQIVTVIAQMALAHA